MICFDKSRFTTKIRCLFYCSLIAASLAYAQTTYYVSSSGSDTSNGTLTSTPWKTITKVNSVTFVSGDAILFRGGDTFFGQININQSGITIGAYDDGLQKPVITGAIQLTGWTVYSGSIYVTQASSLVKNLFANDVQMTLARYPNTGFLSIGTTNGSTTITATGLNQPSGYWNGANVRMRTKPWTFETRTVSSYDGTTITFSSAPDYTLVVGWGFYIDNKFAELDVPGEWYCDSADNKVYFYAPGGVDPNTLTVDGSTLDYGVYGSSQSDITVQDMGFMYQAQAALMFHSTNTNIRLLSNKIFGACVYGIRFDWTSSGCTIDHNTIQQVNGAGISLASASDFVITNNIVRNVGLVQGYGISGTTGMTGICWLGGSGNTISGNIVDSIGYIGIEASGLNTLVENNVVTNVMLKLADGGAIYTYYGSGNTIRNNIISKVVGNKDGATYPGYKESNGIYLDGGSHDIIVEGNTVSHVSTSGIFIQYLSYRNTIHNNTLIDCDLDTHGNFLYILQDTTYSYGQHVITRNVIDPKTANQRLLILQENEMSAVLHSPGIIDSNYYLNPHGNTIPFGTIRNTPSGWAWDDYSFSGWKAVTGLDIHSKHIVPASYQRDTVFINSTAYPMVVNLPPVLFYDLDSNSVVGSFILAPFSSKVLIRDTVRVNSVDPMPLNYYLSPNYPNPFSESTTIEFTMKDEEYATLKVFDVLGREIETLAEGTYSRGVHQCQWNTEGMASGVYYCKFTAGSYTETRSMVLVR